MASIKRALIIGGGIAGPVTALALRKAGIEATIYEAYATTAEGVGGMLMLAPNGLDALRIIGVDASAIGQPIQRMIMGDAAGKQFGEFPGLKGMPPSRLLWRSDLYRLLHDHAVGQGVSIEYGKRLVDVEETTTGVTARFSDGSRASGDIVIGADGIGSKVRALIDSSAPGPAYVGFLGFGGQSPETVSKAPDAMHFVFGKRAFLGHFTPPEGGTAWFSNLPRAEPLTMAEARAIPASEWLRELRAAYADDVPARDLLARAKAEDLLVFGAGEFLPSVPRWHRGRLVLVGDAAHAPSSTSGQGASLAAESAVQLARCLRDLPHLATAFATYEGLRRPRVERVAAFAAKQNNQKVAGPIAKAVMSLLMPIAMRTFLTPKKMFGWMHEYRIHWDEVVEPSSVAPAAVSRSLEEREVAP